MNSWRRGGTGHCSTAKVHRSRLGRTLYDYPRSQQGAKRWNLFWKVVAHGSRSAACRSGAAHGVGKLSADGMTLPFRSIRVTRSLASKVPGGVRVGTRDILLATAQAFIGWTDSSWHAIELGRPGEIMFSDIDLSRTVGWCASLVSMLLDVSEEAPERPRYACFGSDFQPLSVFPHWCHTGSAQAPLHPDLGRSGGAEGMVARSISTIRVNWTHVVEGFIVQIRTRRRYLENTNQDLLRDRYTASPLEGTCMKGGWRHEFSCHQFCPPGRKFLKG